MSSYKDLRLPVFWMPQPIETRLQDSGSDSGSDSGLGSDSGSESEERKRLQLKKDWNGIILSFDEPERRKELRERERERDKR